MSRAERITLALNEALSPQHLDVVNESHQHNVPPGSESHFKVVIVADAFSGKMPVARHKLVYQILDAELKSGLHALSIHGYVQAEWDAKNNTAPASPPCLGGSK